MYFIFHEVQGITYILPTVLRSRGIYKQPTVTVQINPALRRSMNFSTY